MLKSLTTMKFTTKLFVSIVLLCIISILITSGNAIRMSTAGMQKLGQDSLEQMHTAVFNSLLTYNKTIRRKLDSDLGVFEKELKAKGGIILDNYNAIETPITNQVSKQTTTVELPKMMAGGSYITGYNDLVDTVETSTGSSATIFQVIDDKLLRISTTVKKLDGERAIGTYIPSSSPVYQTIMRGEVFRGKAFVVNDWYLTAYAPLRGARGDIIGAIYVGQLMLSPEIKEFVNTTRMGTGRFFIYGPEGNILIHHNYDESTNLFSLIPEFKEHQNGLFEFSLDGENESAVVKYIDEWGLYLGLSIARKDVIQGLDAKMLRNSLLVGAVVVVAGVLLNLLLVRTINRPLKELAEKSVKVGEGDYTIRFESATDDAIGQLANSMGVMVSKSKEMLEDIIRSSKALSAASVELSSISEEMVSNADSTTQIADQASTNATDVSDNMNSISAAMEQSTTNLDMISAAAEEMGTTIQEIAENSSRARQTTEEAVQSAQKSHEGVQELGEAARAIGTVTETITDISEQTNLLALNATIEAARAGEAGKGFAVVANEIKELAKQTANATGKIKQAIDEIQNQTGETVNDIDSIGRVIQDVNEVVNTIVTAVEEQSITTNEIVNNVTQASQGITEINENVASSNEMTTSMSQGVAEVKERSIEVKNRSQSVRSSADELSQLADDLTTLVSKFTIS